MQEVKTPSFGLDMWIDSQKKDDYTTINFSIED